MASICRLAGIIALALLVTACDKCASWKFGVWGASPAADVCTQKPPAS